MKALKSLFFICLLINFKPVLSNSITNCFNLTEKYGKEFNIPDKLLTSISLVESGIKKNNKFVSWPWTLNVAGKSKFFDNKNDALDFLKKNYKNKNKNKNIDVGCMQISLKYHFNEFDSLENILDPDENVKYAAKFLKNLFSKHKRWNEAISRYHSSVPIRKKQYLKRVKNYWADIRQKKIILQPTHRSRTKEKIEFFKKELSNQLNRFES
ncbi:MAG: hypothetical protein CMP38_00820 [Rickettsiales bacterium]|nr:hypothetical protein [Rickettsiales bacterium]|tara:strand:+ start:1972 stop:2604 length:633 start_codon:yes stop_codon:yes gene_type:complete